MTEPFQLYIILYMLFHVVICESHISGHPYQTVSKHYRQTVQLSINCVKVYQFLLLFVTKKKRKKSHYFFPWGIDENSSIFEY